MNISGTGTLLVSHQWLGQEVLVTVTGEIDAEAVPVLKRYLTLLADEPGTRLLLDLTGVSFIDTACFGAIVPAAEHARRRGGRLTFVARYATLRRLAECPDRVDLSTRDPHPSD